MKIWEPQPHGTVRSCPGRFRDCFTCYLPLKLENLKPLKNIYFSNHVKLPVKEITMKNKRFWWCWVCHCHTSLKKYGESSWLGKIFETISQNSHINAITMKCNEPSVLTKTRRTDGGFIDSQSSVYECSPCMWQIALYCAFSTKSA
jgi:hypothetical protein